MKNCKRIIAVLLSTVMFFSVLVPVAGAVEKYSKGDVDGNGRITASDARLALRASVNLEKLYVKAIKAADVNGDDDVTAADARTILRVSVGLESFGTLPAVPSKMPVTTAEICNFYKNGVDRIKNGEAGYRKKEWQYVDAVNIGNSTVNNLFTSVLGRFLTDWSDATEQVNPKGSDEAKNRIAAWTLTDLSKVASATCVADGSNYKITITMMDEDTPKESDSFLGQVTNSILYWEDIEDTLKNDSTVNKILSDFGDIHVIYKGYKIEAVMTPDGKFVSIDHTADVDILIGYAKIIIFTIENKSCYIWKYCKYYNFDYTGKPVSDSGNIPVVPGKMPTTKSEIVKMYCDAYNNIPTAKSITRTYDYTSNYNNILNIDGGNSSLQGIIANNLMGMLMVENTEPRAIRYSALPPRSNTRIFIDPRVIADAKCKDKGDYYEVVLTSTGTADNREVDSQPGSGSVGSFGLLINWSEVASALGSRDIFFAGGHCYYETATVTAHITKDGKMTHIEYLTPCILHFDSVETKVVKVGVCEIGLLLNQKYEITYYTGDANGTDPSVPGEIFSTTEEICEFYKKGVDDIKSGKAGYTKKEWQNVDNINIGSSVVNSAVTSVLGSFVTVEADATEQVNAKGSDEAKNGIAAWTLTGLSKVAWATCVADGSNYKITITMMDEDTPKKSDSFLGQVTNSILYWEDIENTLKNDSTVNKLITYFADLHVIYKGYKIEAVMTPDGKFVSIDHTADVDIIIGEAKILNITVRDKSAHMWNYCKFYDFVY